MQYRLHNIPRVMSQDPVFYYNLRKATNTNKVGISAQSPLKKKEKTPRFCYYTLGYSHNFVSKVEIYILQS